MNEVMTTAQRRLIERSAWTLVWLAILTTGVDAWGQWSQWPGMGVVSPLLVLVAITGATVLWSVREPSSPTLRNASLITSFATVLLTQGASIASRHLYTTDSAAFNQIATRLFLNGKDPYTASFANAAQLLPTASNYWTYTVNGAHVTQISYPAGSFLLQAPLMALGLNHLPTDWLDLAAWMVTIGLLYRILPSPIRWLAPLLLLASAFVGDFANGGTDALFIPFLIVAVWQWDRFVWSKRYTLGSWLSPVALGVACSVKQSPWFCVPFLLLGIGLEARAAHVNVPRTTLRYALITLATFLVINLPFIAWRPSAWLAGVLLPLHNPLVPDGQGLVTLALHGLTGGVELPLLSVAAALAAVAMLAAMYFWYPIWKRTWLFFLPVVLFIPGRSLSNYLLDFFPVAIVAAISVQRAEPVVAPHWPMWTRRAIVSVPVIGAAAVAIVAFTSAPLTVTVDSVQAASNGQAMQSVTITVHNNSSRPVSPNCMIAFGGDHPSGFWRRSLNQGSLPLAPGSSATITLHPLRWTWAPPRADYWLVEVYTSAPSALSTSPLQRWNYGPW